MAATVAWKGFGTVDAADSTTGWTALKISGSGGGPSVAVADGQIEGTAANTIQVNKQRDVIYFDIGAGNELDFTGGGAEEGEMVYIWGNFLAPALLNARNSGGMGIFLESSTPSSTQYHLWYFYGNDNYDGGWKRMVLDPNETVSASAGTGINLASVRYFGLFADVGTNVLRFDNLICDSIEVGTGLTVTGTSTSDDLFGDLLSDENTNRYGIVTSLNDSDTAIELNGELDLGDVTAATNSTFTDVDKKIFLAEPLYYDGTSETTSVPTTYFGINMIGGTGTQSVTFGKKVGSGDTATGRNGLTIIGNDSYDLSIDFDDGNVNTCNIYGCTFENCQGTLSWGTNTAHECIGNVWNNCAQFDPVGGVEIRANTFVNHAGTDAALLWNGSIDIENCQFISNTDGTNDPAGIEHPAQGSFTYTDLTFSANDNDVFYSAAASSGVLTITNSGTSDASTSRILNPTGNSVVFVNNPVTTLVNVKDNDGANLQNARVWLAASDGTGELPFEESVTSITRSGTVATVTHTAHGLKVGDYVNFDGITDKTEDNRGAFQVATVPGANSYTYTTTDSGSTNYTGTITATGGLLYGLTDASGNISVSRSFSGNQPVNGFVRKSSASPRFKTFELNDTVSSTTGLTINLRLVLDE